MEAITPVQRKEFFALVYQLGINAEERKQLVYQYSEERTTSVARDSCFTAQQMGKLLKFLRDLNRTTFSVAMQSEYETVSERRKDEKVQRMRRKIFSLCWQAGLLKEAKTAEERKANQLTVYKTVRKLGYLKPLGLTQYTLEELPKLVTQFEMIVKHNKKTEANKITKSMLEELGMYVAPKNEQ